MNIQRYPKNRGKLTNSSHDREGSDGELVVALESTPQQCTRNVIKKKKKELKMIGQNNGQEDSRDVHEWRNELETIEEEGDGRMSFGFFANVEVEERAARKKHKTRVKKLEKRQMAIKVLNLISLQECVT